VVGLEGVAVGIAERVGKLLSRVGGVVAESLCCEVEAAVSKGQQRMQDWSCLHIPVEPYEALGGSVLLLLELVEDEVLEGFR
jgi:hypothetical protein